MKRNVCWEKEFTEVYCGGERERQLWRSVSVWELPHRVKCHYYSVSERKRAQELDFLWNWIIWILRLVPFWEAWWRIWGAEWAGEVWEEKTNILNALNFGTKWSQRRNAIFCSWMRSCTSDLADHHCRCVTGDILKMKNETSTFCLRTDVTGQPA